MGVAIVRAMVVAMVVATVVGRGGWPWWLVKVVAMLRRWVAIAGAIAMAMAMNPRQWPPQRRPWPWPPP